MKLTVRTILALRTLMFCAVNKDRIVRKQEIAQACNASENHLAHVIHRLAKAGFVATVRGRSGGVRLHRDAHSVRLGDVVRHFEGSIPLTECMSKGRAPCPLAKCCRLNSIFSEALAAFYNALDRKTLADLVEDNLELDRLLRVA